MSWNIQTAASESDIRAFLRKYAPWRLLLTFNGSLSSEEYETVQPFNRDPLAKIKAVESHLPKSVLGGRVLDIGFNCGYNSIYLATTYGAHPVGVDNNPRHQDVAQYLANLSGSDAEFLLADAERFTRQESFDLVVHFGTLYHLPNPMLALRTSAQNLRPGGWLALETTAYLTGSNVHENLWVNGFNNDRTNFWALSKTTLEEMLILAGFGETRLILETMPPIYGGRMSRVTYVACKKRVVKG